MQPQARARQQAERVHWHPARAAAGLPSPNWTLPVPPLSCLAASPPALRHPAATCVNGTKQTEQLLRRPAANRSRLETFKAVWKRAVWRIVAQIANRLPRKPLNIAAAQDFRPTPLSVTRFHLKEHTGDTLARRQHTCGPLHATLPSLRPRRRAFPASGRPEGGQSKAEQQAALVDLHSMAIAAPDTLSCLTAGLVQP